jgi:archaellum component FlaG (FlaF/FlaG flagellin family)
MELTRIKPARTNPIVSISLSIILITAIIGIVYIWNSINQRAGQAMVIQNVVDKNGTITIFVQNIGEETIFLKNIHVDNEIIPILKEMCTINGVNTNELPKESTASISIKLDLESINQIKITGKSGTIAVWNLN